MAINNILIYIIELMDFKTRRVTAFRKNLIELTELEIKHAKVKIFLYFFHYLFLSFIFIFFLYNCSLL